MTTISAIIEKCVENGHTMQYLDENAMVAPGVFAQCINCEAHARFYLNKPMGEAYSTNCRNATQRAPANQIWSNEELAVMHKMCYETNDLDGWAYTVNQYAEQKGWNKDYEEKGFGMVIALMHSELSEALEEYRNGHGLTETYYVTDSNGKEKPEGVPVELVDCMIRIMHFFGYHKIELGAVMQAKHEYNLTRAYRHGNKQA